MKILSASAALASFLLFSADGTAQTAAQPQAAPADRAPAVIEQQGGGVPGFFSRPYEGKSINRFDNRNSPRVYDLLRSGNLYLSLADAIALAIENNLDVEISRYQIPLASSDVDRAKGGGTLRGVSLATTSLPAGVGGPASPLLNIAASNATPSTAVPGDVTNLTALQSSPLYSSILPGGGAAGSPGSFSAGPPLPSFDPALVGNLNWAHATTPNPNPGLTGVNAATSSGWLSSLGLQQGFSTGTSYSLGFMSQSQMVNSPIDAYNPYTTGSLGLTVTQPLLRGFGPAVNRRFIRIAKNDQKISDLNFRQQLINTIFGISRLYYDLAALAEDLHVKEDTLDAANTLYKNTKAAVDEGTMAPVELTRAEAQVAGAEQDLVNSRGLFDEQEVIMKNLLSRRGTEDPLIQNAHLVPTESLSVPDNETLPALNNLIEQAAQNRPDILETEYELTNSNIQLSATRNELLPQLDIVGNASNSGLSGDPNARFTGGTPNGVAASSAMIGGYSNLLDQIFSRKYPSYSIGIQLNLPIRNRIAQADVVRDEFGVREVQARRQSLQNQSRLEVEDALVGLQRARAAYTAAVRTRMLQERSLQIERVRYQAGVDTAFFVIQYQSYVAQARSTEVAAKGNYFKAKANLDRATGVTLETHQITVGEAYHGRVSQPAAQLPAPR